MRVNAESYADFIDYLVSQDGTAHQIVAYTGLGMTSVVALVKALHARGCVHRCGWRKDTLGRDAIAIWRFGPGPDKRREKFTQKQRSERWARANRKRQVDARIGN